MADRVGIGFYWLGCILAAAWTAYWLYVYITKGGGIAAVFGIGPLADIFVPAGALWLVGRSLRRALAGH